MNITAEGDFEGQVFVPGTEPRTYDVKFTHLDLNNFRGHQELHLELTPVTVVYGPNGSGKSAVRDALEWLLSGRCPCTNERGQGPVGYEGREPSVTATIPGGGTITRTGSRLACSWAPGAKKPETAMAPVIGCEVSRARMSMQAGRFFKLTNTDRKALLWDVLDLGVTPDQVEEFLERCGQNTDLLLTVVPRASLGQLELVHDKLYARRREVNRKVDQLKGDVKLMEAQREDSDRAFLTEGQIQELLEEDEALGRRDRELLAEEQKTEHNLELMRRELDGLERAAEAQRFCGECGTPTAAQSLLVTAGAPLREAIERGEAAKPAFLETLRLESQEIARKRAEIRDKVQDGRGFRESLSNLNAAREGLKRAVVEAEGLNLLLEYFGDAPGGIMHRLIRPRIERFEAELNAVSKAWGIKIAYTSALSVEACQYHTPLVPYEGLSDGQQLLVSLAHQVVFARKFGFGLVCLDRIEALDAANRWHLFELCAELVSQPDRGVKQVFLFGVLDARPKMDADWLSCHELADHVLNHVVF